MEERNQYLYNYISPARTSRETSLFLAKGRISRKSYSLRFLFSASIFAAIVLIYSDLQNGISPDVLFSGKSDLPDLFLTLSFLLFMIFLSIQRIKRMHDIDKSGWFSLLPLLVLRKGTIGNNNYGLDPLLRPPVFYDQIKDPSEVEAVLNARRMRHKSNLFLYFGIVLFLLILSVTSHIIKEINIKPAVISADSIPGLYTVRQYSNNSQGAVMYAEIKKRNRNEFEVKVMSNIGKDEYSFMRNDDGTLFSIRLGHGDAAYSSVAALGNIVLKFSKNNGLKWEFSKSR